jgi:hypothetical protein
VSRSDGLGVAVAANHVDALGGNVASTIHAGVLRIVRGQQPASAPAAPARDLALPVVAAALLAGLWAEGRRVRRLASSSRSRPRAFLSLVGGVVALAFGAAFLVGPSAAVGGFSWRLLYRLAPDAATTGLAVGCGLVAIGGARLVLTGRALFRRGAPPASRDSVAVAVDDLQSVSS